MNENDHDKNGNEYYYFELPVFHEKETNIYYRAEINEMMWFREN